METLHTRLESRDQSPPVPVRGALHTHLSLFFRDDNAGWDDASLARLCQLFYRRGLPLDIAVIPQAVTEKSVSLMMRICRRADSLIHLHQHGYTHANHQLQGRSAEFGSDRPTVASMRILRGAGHCCKSTWVIIWNR